MFLANFWMFFGGLFACWFQFKLLMRFLSVPTYFHDKLSTHLAPHNNNMSPKRLATLWVHNNNNIYTVLLARAKKEPLGNGSTLQAFIIPRAFNRTNTSNLTNYYIFTSVFLNVWQIQLNEVRYLIFHKDQGVKGTVSREKLLN